MRVEFVVLLVVFTVCCRLTIFSYCCDLCGSVCLDLSSYVLVLRVSCLVLSASGGFRVVFMLNCCYLVMFLVVSSVSRCLRSAVVGMLVYLCGVCLRVVVVVVVAAVVVGDSVVGVGGCCCWCYAC